MDREGRLPAFQDHEQCSILSAALNAQLVDRPEWGRRRSYPARSVLWNAEEVRHRVYLLEAGRVQICERAPDGSEPVIETVQAGQLFGELCFCQYRDFPLGTSARAVTASRVIEAAAMDFDDLLQKKPAFTAKLIATFCEKLERAETRARILAIRDGRRRMEETLLHLWEIRGRCAEPDSGKVTLTVSHAELANLTAMTRPHTTVIMTQLRSDGIVAYSRGSVLTINVGLLTVKRGLLA